MACSTTAQRVGLQEVLREEVGVLPRCCQELTTGTFNQLLRGTTRRPEFGFADGIMAISSARLHGQQQLEQS